MNTLASKVAAISVAVLFVVTTLTSAMLLGTSLRTAPRAETIYVRNVAPQYISNRTITRDIPAWTDAMNKDVSPAWDTPQVRFVFIGRKSAPEGAITATFVDKGPQKGALAYHTVTRGAPAIIIYAGTADYYGYSNSVSFTHEVEELLADPTTSIANQGWPYDYINVGSQRQSQLEGTIWINEIADPVEAFHYERQGVAISDFITPNWFNDEVNGPYDYMHLVQQPFTILKGGYAQYWTSLGWQQVVNFRGAGPDAAGFLQGEQLSGR